MSEEAYREAYEDGVAHACLSIKTSMRIKGRIPSGLEHLCNGITMPSTMAAVSKFAYEHYFRRKLEARSIARATLNNLKDIK